MDVEIPVRQGYQEEGVPLPELMRAFADARWAAFETGWLGVKEARDRGEKVFVVSQTVEVGETVGTLKRGEVGEKVRGTLKVVKVGNTSFALKIMLEYYQAALKAVAQNTLTYVFTGKDGKPHSIPETVRDHLQRSLSSETVTHPPSPTGPTPYTYSFTVRPSDCDWNHHMNQSQYVTLLTDALHTHTNVATRPTTLGVNYKKQLKQGDEAVVRISEPQGTTVFSITDAEGEATYANGYIKVASSE